MLLIGSDIKEDLQVCPLCVHTSFMAQFLQRNSCLSNASVQLSHADSSPKLLPHTTGRLTSRPCLGSCETEFDGPHFIFMAIFSFEGIELVDASTNHLPDALPLGILISISSL
jgi:hypothetical protein